MGRLHRPAWVTVVCFGAASQGISLAAAAASPPARVSCHIHEAVAGDTLIALAQQHLARPSDWRALARINRISEPRRIPIGKKLCLPVHLLRPTPLPGVVLDVTGEVTRQPPGSGVPARRSTSTPTARPPAEPASAPSPEPVAEGDAIPPGTRLRTGANGYVTVQLPDGSVLRIQSDTDARLTQSQRYETTGFFSSMWELLHGRVESLVTPATRDDDKPRHQIKTPHATLGVRGTTFRVTTDSTRTLGETLSGSVAVRSGRAETMLQAGHGTVAHPQHGPGAPIPLPPKPDVSTLPTLQERVVMKFELPAMSGASSYRVQVAQDANFQRVRGEAISATPLLRLTDLPDGDYVLRARVANAQGLESADAVHAFRLKARPEPPIPLGPAHQAKLRASTAQLSWATHPRATHYRLQIAQDGGFKMLVHEQLALTATDTTVDLVPGDYHWRVASTATGRDDGPWGDAQVLRMREPPAQPPPPKVSDTTLSFQLQAEPGQRFELQLTRDASFATLLEEIHSIESQVVATRPDEGGLLFVRYRAIDEDGFVGPYSAAQMVALPPCVRSASGRCVQAGPRYLTSRP